MRKGPLEDDLQYIAKYPLQYEQLKETTVLVTGATGLIGASIVRALIAVEGIHIIALVRNIEKANKLYSRHELDNIELIVGDITFPINVNKKVDWIFHCAAVTTSKLMIEKPVETLSTAIEGTKNILELARKNECKSMVYISSTEMYGTFNNSDTEITEDKIGYINPLKVRSNYPESKRLCENMCVAYMREYGVKVKIARLAQTFGAGILPGENRVFAQFAKSVISGRDIVLHTRGLSEGNYCYTRDCVLGLFIILLCGENGEAYNVANQDTYISIKDMALFLKKNFNPHIDVIVEEHPEMGYAPVTKLNLSAEKLMNLGWKPRYDLRQMFEHLIKALKEK